MDSWSMLLEELKLYMPFILLVLSVLLFRGIKKYLRKHKINKLKYEGEGIMKKTTVSAVRERYVSGSDDSSGYYLYRLESIDENGNVYSSEEFKDAEHGGRTLEEMVKKYDGEVYDLGNKDVTIRQINNNIQRLEMELSNDPGFFKKRELKKDIEAMKNYIDIANEGPVDPYLVVNGHKISVGDPIDVYIDPENPNLYYFDLDFTKQN